MQITVDDSDFRLYVGDVREVLATMPAGSVDCCVTSPPYWGLRDYGSEGQIGLEETPDAYVAELVSVFREVRRVLADHGTLWLNLGDSYANDTKWGGSTGGKHVSELHDAGGLGREKRSTGLKAKDLVGIPWRVAFALQADGWYLRSDIIWAKPNPMPESVTDRPTKAHEYVFLLSKQPRYFFDQEAVRERALTPDRGPGMTRGVNGPHAEQAGLERRARRTTALIPNQTKEGVGRQGLGSETFGEFAEDGGRNIRSVWGIATQPYAEAHFATFPEALPARCIKAGCPERVCRSCGKASERIVETEYVHHANWFGNKQDARHDRGKQGTSYKEPVGRSTTGWSDCGHNDWRPGTVLDPFMGSGTTALVARRLGRKSVGVELNPEYAELCARRLQQLSLFG